MPQHGFCFNQNQVALYYFYDFLGEFLAISISPCILLALNLHHAL